MMRYLPIFALVALFLACPWQSHAAGKPVLQPTRDVIVTYEITRADQPGRTAHIRISYADQNQRVRMDFLSPLTDQPFGSIIYDQPGNRVLTLLPKKGIYYQVPATGRANPGLLLNGTMQYSQTGTLTVANLSCTEWQVSNGADYQGTACVTDDGVALRATRSKPNQETIEAVDVKFSTPPASIFQPPPDLKPAPTPAPAQ